MLFLNKLLPVFVLPTGWVVVLLVIALVCRRRWPLVAALIVFYVSSMPLVGDRLFHGLESFYPPTALDQLEKADAIVPLGGIFGPSASDGMLPNLGEANERLEAGIQLWERHKAPWLVFTGGRVPWARQNSTEGALSARAARARGIPADKILLTREVGNTADEARAVAALMRERGWTKIVLVTSGYHMPRAAHLFRKAGVDFVPFPVDFQIDPRSPLTMLDLLPQADGLRHTEAALREWYGIAFYMMIGR
jgi:uncharacterized SAM-binding protein YcdF (DUF218 family)